MNAHVLVMRYGDFEEYRDVIARATDMPEVAGAGPFLICLAPANRDHEPLDAEREIGHLERHELRAAERAGEAEHEERAIA